MLRLAWQRRRHTSLVHQRPADQAAPESTLSGMDGLPASHLRAWTILHLDGVPMRRFPAQGAPRSLTDHLHMHNSVAPPQNPAGDSVLARGLNPYRAWTARLAAPHGAKPDQQRFSLCVTRSA